MISIVILTRNEERDLPGCLASVKGCDDVHVFDSCSTDATAEIAKSMGAQVHRRRFDSYAAQRNAALATVPFRHGWVFVLDADERLTPALWAEALDAIRAADPAIAAFRVRRRDYFLGRELRHAQMLPWYTRLVRLGRVRYTPRDQRVCRGSGYKRAAAGKLRTTTLSAKGCPAGLKSTTSTRRWRRA